MGTPWLLYSLTLILSLQIVPFQSGEGRMMQDPGIRIRDTLQMLLETRPHKGAPLNSEGPQGYFVSIRPRWFPCPARKRPRRHTRDRPEEQECHLRSLLVRIKDLGLGYESEETILFKYCSGSCPKARSNHDLTLALLLQKSRIPALGEPCCRPSHYEDVAFLDDSHQWHEVEKLSASSCSCMG